MNDLEYLEVAHRVRKESRVKRGKVGVVIAKQNLMVVAVCNGAMNGDLDCTILGCDVHKNEHFAHCAHVVHAETKAIASCARMGAKTLHATMYSTHSPCFECAKVIVTAGIARYVYTTPYKDQSGLRFLEHHGIHVYIA